MDLFKKKKDQSLPRIQSDKYELVLRCSICTGEQVLCQMDRKNGSLKELMLIRSSEDLLKICENNNIKPESIKRIY